MRNSAATQSGAGGSDASCAHPLLPALQRGRDQLGMLVAEDMADASLARGASGLALTHAVLHASFDGGPLADPADAGRAERYAELALGHVSGTGAGGDRPAAFFSGLLGTAWALVTAGFDIDVDDVDRFALRLAQLQPWPGAIDLTDGIVGVGVYGLSRLGDGPGATIVAAVTDRLRENCVEARGGAWWPTPPDRVPAPRRAAFPSGYIDVGVAHGHAGVVAFLAAATAAGVTAARPLLIAAARWLAAQRAETGSGTLPLLVVDGKPAAGGRLAWCYGDAGGAAALLAAAEALEDEELMTSAVTLAAGAASRALADAGATDAGLCHGAAGIAHILRRLAVRTGGEALAAAAQRWFEEAGRLPDAGSGLLEGTAGTVLALASAVAGDDPAWDGFLLLRPPSAWTGA